MDWLEVCWGCSFGLSTVSNVAATYAAVALTALAAAAAAAAAATTATLPASPSLLERFKRPSTADLPGESGEDAAAVGEAGGSSEAEREMGRGAKEGAGMMGVEAEGEEEAMGGEVDDKYI